MTAQENKTTFDFHALVSVNRVKGLWMLLTGFRLAYVGATVALAIARDRVALAMGNLKRGARIVVAICEWVV